MESSQNSSTTLHKLHHQNRPTCLRCKCLPSPTTSVATRNHYPQNSTLLHRPPLVLFAVQSAHEVPLQCVTHCCLSAVRQLLATTYSLLAEDDVQLRRLKMSVATLSLHLSFLTNGWTVSWDPREGRISFSRVGCHQDCWLVAP